MDKSVKCLCLNIFYVLYVLLWIKYCLMCFKSLLVFILFKFKKCPNISGIRVVVGNFEFGLEQNYRTVKTWRFFRNSPFKLLKWKWKWSDMWPSMVTHTRNLCSAINPSKVHTHSSEHTYTVNTHPEQWAAIYAAAPGEQLGVRHLSRGIEGGERAL